MNQKIPFTKSIRFRFTIYSAMVIVFVVALGFLLNSLFLENYYDAKKQDALKICYRSIKQYSEGQSDPESFKDELFERCRTYNISVCVLDEESKIKFYSDKGDDRMEYRLLSLLFDIAKERGRAIEQTEDYVLQYIGDSKDGEFVEMWGRFDNGISFLLQTPMESIRETSRIAREFYFVAGLFGLLIGSVIIWIITRRLTKPIEELNNLSTRMVQLDFDAKYTGTNDDEIGELGRSMNALSASLEQSIGELKHANLELQKDIEQKEQIDAMRKEFVGNVSHELKTPITLIQGYAEGLKANLDSDAETRDYYCDVIMDEAAKMNTLVKQLLTLSQLESGKDVVVMERINLSELVNSVVQNSTVLAESFGVSLISYFEPDIIAWGDEFMVEGVLTNYLTNAIHYAKGGKKVEISMEKKDSAIRVKVFNEGDPIAEEALGQIWDKFYKVDKARTREYGGSGIGLSIVKATMEALKQPYGVINYKNGVTFWFELEVTAPVREV